MSILDKLRAPMLAALMSVALVGCESLDDDDDPDVIPELVEMENRFDAQIKWQEQIGDGAEEHFSRLVPLIYKDVVYVAGREGEVKALNFADGEEVWSVDLRKSADGFFSSKAPALLSGGVSQAYGKLYIGTEHGEVIALDINDGSELWRVKVPGEVIAPVGTGEGLLFVNTASGLLIALHPDNGEERWKFEQEVPPLTLRGVSTPIVANGGVIFGSADGKLNVVIAKSGLEAWRQSVATSTGASELERLIDVDTQPLMANGVIYSLAYNGNLIAAEMQSGKISWRKEYSAFQNMAMEGLTLYLTDVNDHIYAVDARNGDQKWENTSLTRRGLTGGYVAGDYLVMGDTEGWLHWFDKETGDAVSRTEMDDSGFYVWPVGKDGAVLVVTRDGELSAIEAP